MTTRTHLFALCAALLLASPLAAGGRRDYVSVAFASAKDQKTLHDGGLDGSVKFYWSNEGGPKGGKELSARGFSRRGATDQERCAKAVAAALVSFQKRAKKEGYNAVVDIRTFSERDRSSGDRNKCLCVSGGLGTKTTIKGRLAKLK
jgi:hypothetical protein